MTPAAPTLETPGPVRSVCLYCGASETADPDFLAAAAEFGAGLAGAGVRLVYGGGGIGLMGAAARAAKAAGGRVLGVMPEFLRRSELLYDEVETVVVRNMHERKRIMFDEAEGFAVLPGGIGTLEEAVELISWRRLDLHAKPIVFLNLKGFWDPFFRLIDHTVEGALTPAWLPSTWGSVARADEILPMIQRMAHATSVDDGEVAAKA